MCASQYLWMVMMNFRSCYLVASELCTLLVTRNTRILQWSTLRPESDLLPSCFPFPTLHGSQRARHDIRAQADGQIERWDGTRATCVICRSLAHFVHSKLCGIVEKSMENQLPPHPTTQLPNIRQQNPLTVHSHECMAYCFQAIKWSN